MKLRAMETSWQAFLDRLRSRNDVETAGLILAKRLHGGKVLLVRDLIDLSKEGYQIRRHDQIRLDPACSIAHPTGPRQGALDHHRAHSSQHDTPMVFRSRQRRGRPLDAILAQPNAWIARLYGHRGDTGIAIGRLWADEKGPPPLGLRVIGKTLTSPALDEWEHAESAWLARQGFALDAAGQKRRKALHVGLVGLGGTGSVAFCQLAHLGVHRIAVIVGDRVEPTNVSRTLGATVRDAGRTWKVDVAARYATQLGLETQVVSFRGHLGSEVGVKELEECDVVFSCVDKHLPRALLNRLAYQRAIPLIDMESSFRVNAQGRITQ